MEQNHLLAIRRELETLDRFRGVRNLLAVRTVGVHSPQLSTCQESNLSVIPGRIGLALATCGQSGVACTISVDDGNLLQTLISLYAVVANLVNNLLTIGRSLGSTYTTHGPKCLGGHQVAGKLDILFPYLHVFCCFNGIS